MEVELPREVRMSIDPIVDMIGFSKIKGVPIRDLESARRTDPGFPAAIGELSCGPVFAYGAIRDYLDGPHSGDKQLREDLANRPAGPGIDNAFIAIRYQDVPPIGDEHNPVFVSPVWEEENSPLSGGRWVAAVFSHNDADNSDLDEDDEPEDRYEVLAEIDLGELMVRRDWTMWLQLHIGAMTKLAAEVKPVIDAMEEPNPTKAVREQALIAVAALERLRSELADAAIQKIREPECPHQALTEALAGSTIYIDNLLFLEGLHTSAD